MSEVSAAAIGTRQTIRDKFPPNGPHQVVVNADTGDVFVSSEKDATVSVFNAKGDCEVVKLPGGGLPAGTKLQMALSPSDHSAVVLADTPQAGSKEGDSLFKITPSGSGIDVQGPLFVESGDYPRGSFSVDAQTGTTYLVNSRTGNLTIIPQNSDTAFHQVDVGVGRAQVAADPGDNGCFVLHEARGQLFHISANDTSSPINVGGSNDRYQMEVIPESNQVAVLNETQHKLMRVSSDGNVTEWNLPRSEHHMAVNHGNSAIIVTNRDANNAIGFPNADNVDGIEFKTGAAPQAVVIDSNNQFSFIQNASNTLSVLDQDGNLINVNSDNVDLQGVSVPTLEAGPRAMALDSREHALYIANEQSGTLTRMTQEGAVVSTLGKYEDPPAQPAPARPAISTFTTPSTPAATPAEIEQPREEPVAEEPIAGGGKTCVDTLKSLPPNNEWKQGLAPKGLWQLMDLAAQQLQKETMAILDKPITPHQDMETALFDDKMGTHKLSDDELAELKAGVNGEVGPIKRKAINDAFAAMEKALRDSPARWPDPKQHIPQGADYKDAFKIRYFAGPDQKLVQFKNDSVQTNGLYNLHADDKIADTIQESIDLLHQTKDKVLHSLDQKGPASKQTEGLWKKTSVAQGIDGMFGKIHANVQNIRVLAEAVCSKGITVSSRARDEQ